MNSSIATVPRMPSTTRTTRGCVLFRGMQSVTPRDAVGGLEVGLEHQRMRPVPPRGADHLAGRGDPPGAVVLGPEQRREARGRVEPRQAEPVDRSVLADQRRGAQVADDAVILDRQRHRSPPVSPCYDATVVRNASFGIGVPPRARCRPVCRVGRRAGIVAGMEGNPPNPGGSGTFDRATAWLEDDLIRPMADFQDPNMSGAGCSPSCWAPSSSSSSRRVAG